VSLPVIWTQEGGTRSEGELIAMSRGELRIYEAAPGAGETYAMLTEGRRRRGRGTDLVADRVDAALANYFRVGNLAAARALALRWVADRVDDDRERHGITESWETRERLVVAVTGAPAGDQLIRRGARIAARNNAELVGVHVPSADGRASAREKLHR
jgi:K+-sensing histidine kinase KdpD